ncbi:50S ribosomal protein L10 [Alkalibacter rhizosphaerae]|uniref:Large ribosomal subunit protein uL10 n=1 Tax=Alkalibacter rhizosphaerae TaxID=2815577 RepID=A0A974XCW8_9FIRM|nr:50S ribosomal protein L10 [Alkalibacter rhizosphaerae]QSX07499.1 50S ribosomal protein L10 [Alkalibacter rhizosphaerae]
MSIRELKEDVVKEISTKMENAQSMILVDYRGLNVEELNEFRSIARQASVDYKVYKNTMMRFAAKETGNEGLLDYLVGPTAVAFSTEDPVAAAKVITEFAKKHKAMEVKGGLVGGKVISIEEIKDLAELPPKEVLVAKVLGGLNAPIAGFVGVLQANISGLARALDQVRGQKEASA